MTSAGVRIAARRVQIARALLLLPFVVLAARSAHLSVFDPRGLRLGRAQSQRTLTLAAERGTVYDRAGVELALTVEAPSVYAVPAEIPDPAATARALARALGLRAEGVAEQLRAGPGFRFVARWVDREQAQRVLALDLAGVGVIDEPRRAYPHGPLGAQVVGFANIDGVGVRGLEQEEDSWLRGTQRRVRVERDARGRLLVAEGRSWSTTGGDVELTLDATLQAGAESALRAALERTGAKGGVVLSLDPGSGEILSLVEAPSFDPNQFRELDYHATRSRAFLDASDPGSTLKAFLVAAALEKQAIRPGDTFDCSEGSLRVPGKTIRDRRPFGVLDAPGVLRVSSNVGAVHIAHALGASDHFEMLRRFGFGESTGSGFPDESAGVLRPWRSWKPVDHATIAFGQGLSVTPVQLAAATAVFANGGEWLPPTLVRARRAADAAWRPTERAAPRRVLAPATAAAVLAMLEGVAGPEGTGRLAALRDVRVAGKTGTAQKFDRAAGQYSTDRFVAWFTGVAPADDPRLVIVVALDEPQRPLHTGGSGAAPLFADVAATQLRSFGILTEPQAATPPFPSVRVTRAAPAPDETTLAVPARPAPAVASAPAPARPPARIPEPAEPLQMIRMDDLMLVPDFREQTDTAVRRFAAGTGLVVEITGSGRAVAQEPPAGSVVPFHGGIVRVRFQADGGEI